MGIGIQKYGNTLDAFETAWTGRAMGTSLTWFMQ